MQERGVDGLWELILLLRERMEINTLFSREESRCKLRRHKLGSTLPMLLLATIFHERCQPGNRENPQKMTKKWGYCVHWPVSESELLVMWTSTISYCFSQLESISAQKILSVRKSSSSPVCLRRGHHVKANWGTLEETWQNGIHIGLWGPHVGCEAHTAKRCSEWLTSCTCLWGPHHYAACDSTIVKSSPFPPMAPWTSSFTAHHNLFPTTCQAGFGLCSALWLTLANGIWANVVHATCEQVVWIQGSGLA
jgi:hypothetical protein